MCTFLTFCTYMKKSSLSMSKCFPFYYPKFLKLNTNDYFWFCHFYKRNFSPISKENVYLLINITRFSVLKFSNPQIQKCNWLTVNSMFNLLIGCWLQNNNPSTTSYCLWCFLINSSHYFLCLFNLRKKTSIKLGMFYYLNIFKKKKKESWHDNIKYLILF